MSSFLKSVWLFVYKNVSQFFCFLCIWTCALSFDDGSHPNLNSYTKTNFFCEKFLYTVRMIEIAHFSVYILLLHHYKSDLAHISDFDSLVIGISQSERWAKNIKKRMTSSIWTKFAHFWVVSARKWMVKKYLISYRFILLDRFFFVIFWYFRTSFFYIIWSRRSL